MILRCISVELAALGGVLVIENALSFIVMKVSNKN